MRYAGVESSTLEFKKKIPKNEQIIQTIIGFCNQQGGKLVIGVANDGEVVGILEEEAAISMENLSKAICEATAPAILPLVYTQTIGDQTLLIIEVSAGTNKPYYRRSEGLDRGTYIRLGSSTLKANADLVEELKWQSRGKAYDSMPVYQSAQADLNEQAIRDFIESKLYRNGLKNGEYDQEAGKSAAKLTSSETDSSGCFGIERKHEPISIDLLLSYYLIFPEHAHTYATVAGILLFGKKTQYFLPEAFIICSHFKGVEGREPIASIDCAGTLFDQFHSALYFIVSRLSRSFTIKKPKREEVLEIPEDAIREALLNAIVHRNYHLKSSIKIAIYDDRVEIFSPGTLPGPLNLQNLKAGFSYIRNLAIYKIFREAGYIEKLGSGFLTIFKSYENRNLKTPVILEGENYVKCILPRVFAQEADSDPILNLFHLGSKITVSDVVKHLHVSRATAGRRLNSLVKAGSIEKVGKGRGVKYIACD